MQAPSTPPPPPRTTNSLVYSSIAKNRVELDIEAEVHTYLTHSLDPSRETCDGAQGKRVAAWMRDGHAILDQVEDCPLICREFKVSVEFSVGAKLDWLYELSKKCLRYEQIARTHRPLRE